MQREKTEMYVQQMQIFKNVHCLWPLHLSFFFSPPTTVNSYGVTV